MLNAFIFCFIALISFSCKADPELEVLVIDGKEQLSLQIGDYSKPDTSHPNQIKSVPPEADPPPLIPTSKKSKFAHLPYNDIVIKYASLFEVDPALVHAVLNVESSGNPRAISTAGAIGLMQLIPSTAKRFGVSKDMLFNPDSNIKAGIAYLKWLMILHNNNKVLAIASYNAGEGSVLKYGNIPPYAETRKYVPKVLAKFAELSKL